MGIPDHLTYLLRNLYAGQEATVRTRYATIDWFKIGKGVRQGCILSPCLFNLYTEYIMQNTSLNEALCAIKTAERNISNLRYADDIILIGTSQRWTKEPLDEGERREWKAVLKQHSKNEYRAIWSHHFKANSWAWEHGNCDRLYFLGLQNHCRGWQKPWD